MLECLYDLLSRNPDRNDAAAVAEAAAQAQFIAGAQPPTYSAVARAAPGPNPQGGYSGRAYGGQQGRGYGAATGDRRGPCHDCGKAGHWARECAESEDIYRQPVAKGSGRFDPRNHRVAKRPAEGDAPKQ